MLRHSLRRPLLIAVLCAIVGAAAGIAGTAASPKHRTNKSTNSPSTARPGMRGDFHRGPGGPAVHVEAVVLNKAGDGFITVTSDHGKVKSISGNDLTITEAAGNVTYKDVTVTVPDDATVQRDFKDAKLSDVKVGDFVGVDSSSDGTRVFAISPDFKPQGMGERGHDFHGGPPPGAPPADAPPAGAAY